MDYEANDSIYCYPGTSTLKNRLNIKDPVELQNVERELSVRRLTELDKRPLKDELSFDYLRKIHKELFGDLYEWAGQMRTVRISKGFMFAYPEHINEQGKYIFRQLKNDNYLKGLSKEQFSEKLAYYKAELNVLHPFREGNGRIIRAFIQKLAESNGYYLNFDKIGKDEYHNAMIKSPYDTADLNEIIFKALDQINLNLELIKQYESEIPAIKHISEQTAEKISRINENAGSPLSINEIKRLYKEAGKKCEIEPSKDTFEQFNELKDIIEDIQNAKRLHKIELSQNMPKEPQVHKGPDLEI